VTTLWGGYGVDVHLFEESGLECLEIVILQSSIPIAFKEVYNVASAVKMKGLV